jgi:hypothetical protein
MTKNLVIVALVAVVATGVAGYYFGYDHGWERSINNDQNPEVVETGAFKETGTLTRNSAHVSEPWYLVYFEGQLGARESTVRLGFEGDAICSRDQENIACADFEFRPNDSVEVTGERKTDYIAVSKLDVIMSAPQPAITDTFKETLEYGFYGTITLTGYIDVQKRICQEDMPCGATVDYASFVFTSGANDALRKFTGQNTGNSFIAGDRVGIGCHEQPQSRIYYENDADSGYITGEIKSTDYTRLMASTKDKPVQLKLTREIYTSGRGAPDCYSHFRNFDVL